MNVRLIALSNPIVIAELAAIPRTLTAEDLMVYCARVSSPANQPNLDTGERLLNYCVKHKHWSIFEMASMTVEITTSRAVAQQILRHRSFSFQEFSQRYAVATDHERPQFRMKGGTNRQGSTAEVLTNEALESLARYSISSSFDAYAALLDAGVAPECARFVLPLCTRTRLYMTGTCRSWIHYLMIRLDSHAQKEHRDVATAIKEVFQLVFPQTYSACNGFEACD